MADIEKREISELVTLYNLEPQLRDVFVEGVDDVAMLRWYLHGKSQKYVSVCEVNVIDVPNEIVEKYGLEVGNRGRLLALANELTKQLNPTSSDCATLIYDKDNDTSGSGLANAIATDFSCLEMYLFNEITFHKFFALVTLATNVDVRLVLSELAIVLVRVNQIKATNHALGLGMEWISFLKLCEFDDYTIRFDEKEFVNRYLMNGSCLDKKKEFESKLALLDAGLTQDDRHHINGHHFYDLAQAYFRRFAKDKSCLKEKRVFERSLVGCVELSYLDERPLFISVLARVTA